MAKGLPKQTPHSQEQVLRRLLGVPNNTCEKMLYAEFARQALPLRHFWWQQGCEYNERLMKMDDSRLCKLAFLVQCRDR